jgi:hypothetical protein
MSKRIEVTELMFNKEIPYEVIEYENAETPYNHPSLEKSIILTPPQSDIDLWRVHLCNLDIMEIVFLFDLLDHALHGETYSDLENYLLFLLERTEFLEKELEEANDLIRVYETGRW